MLTIIRQEKKRLRTVSLKYNSVIYFRHFLKHQPQARIYKRFQLFDIVEGAVVKCSRVILRSNRSKRIEGDFCCDVDLPQGKDKVDHFCGSLVFASPYSADSTKDILQPVASHKLFFHKTLRSTIPSKKVMPATINEVL